MPCTYPHFCTAFSAALWKAAKLRNHETNIKSFPPLAALRYASADCDRSLLRRPSPASWSDTRYMPCARSISQRIFHDAIFQRVEADDHQPSARLQDLRRLLSHFSSCLRSSQFTVHQNSECLKGPCRWMNTPFSLVHWPGRSRYHLRKLCGCMNRPRPNNGSGDSPRPPFLTEFVNRVGKLALVEAVYHLFGGQPRLRIHPHIQGPFRLKTESSRRIFQLHRADAQVGQQPIHRSLPPPALPLRQTMACTSSIFGQSSCQLRRRASSAARAPAPTLPDPYRSQSNDPVRRGVLRFRNCARPSPGSRRYKFRRAERPGIRSLVVKEPGHGQNSFSPCPPPGAPSASENLCPLTPISEIANGTRYR